MNLPFWFTDQSPEQLLSGHIAAAPVFTLEFAKLQDESTPSIEQPPSSAPPPQPGPKNDGGHCPKPLGSIIFIGLLETYAYRFHDCGLAGSTASRLAGSGAIQRPSEEEYWRNCV